MTARVPIRQRHIGPAFAVAAVVVGALGVTFLNHVLLFIVMMEVFGDRVLEPQVSQYLVVMLSAGFAVTTGAIVMFLAGVVFTIYSVVQPRVPRLPPLRGEEDRGECGTAPDDRLEGGRVRDQGEGPEAPR